MSNFTRDNFDFTLMDASDKPYAWLIEGVDLALLDTTPEALVKNAATVGIAALNYDGEMTDAEALELYFNSDDYAAAVRYVSENMPNIGGGADEPLYRVVSDLLGQDVEYATLSQIEDVANGFGYDGWNLRVLTDDWHVVLEAVRDGSEDWKPSRSNEWRDGVGDGEVWTLTLAEIKVD